MQLVRLVIVVVLSLMLMTDWSEARIFGPGKCIKMRQVVAVFVVVVDVVVLLSTSYSSSCVGCGVQGMQRYVNLEVLCIHFG